MPGVAAIATRDYDSYLVYFFVAGQALGALLVGASLLTVALSHSLRRNVPWVMFMGSCAYF
jgi:hypothetical protein